MHDSSYNYIKYATLKCEQDFVAGTSVPMMLADGDKVTFVLLERLCWFTTAPERLLNMLLLLSLWVGHLDKMKVGMFRRKGPALFEPCFFS